jgi:hypothetical protein
VLGHGVGFGVQTAVVRLTKQRGWKRGILVSVFFLLNIFVLDIELFGCVGTGNAPLSAWRRLLMSTGHNKFVDLGLFF